MDLKLHEKFVLLTINDEKGNIAYGYSNTYGFAGAILMELVQKELITLEDKKIVLTDKSDDSEILTEAIELLKTKKLPIKVQNAIQLLSNKFHKKFDEVIQGLIEKGILKLEEKKVLWVFNIKHFPTKNSEPEHLVKSKIKGVVLYGDHADFESLSLIGLINVLELHKEIFNKEEMKKAKQKIKEILKKDNIANDIQAIIQDEIMTAVALSLITTSVATSS